MMKRRRHTVAALAACLATGLLLAACSKSAPVAKTASTAQTASAVQTTAAVSNASSAPSSAPSTSAPSTSATSTGVASTAPASTDATPAEVPSEGGTACTLVTEQDVAAALGRDPGPGSADTGEGGSSQCQYGSFQNAFVLVNLNPSQGKAFYDNAHSNPKVSEAGAITDVAGVGDRAFGISGHGAASIYFNKGDALVLVMVSIRSAASPPEPQTVALAKTAASRV
jgi:hypothetical protein